MLPKVGGVISIFCLDRYAEDAKIPIVLCQDKSILDYEIQLEI